MELSKELLARKNANDLLKTTQRYCACHTKRLSTHYETPRSVTKCHACHAKRGYAKRGYATIETSKSDHFCRTRHRHGHSDLARTVANGCGRLRNVLRTQPQPPGPKVKREPLLRIREKLAGNIFNHVSVVICKVQIREEGRKTRNSSKKKRTTIQVPGFLHVTQRVQPSHGQIMIGLVMLWACCLCNCVV